MSRLLPRFVNLCGRGQANCPAALGSLGPESPAKGPCRRRPRSAILFRSRARGCSRGVFVAALVVGVEAVVSARRHDGAVALAHDCFLFFCVSAIASATGGHARREGSRGERAGEQRSGWRRNRPQRSDVGGDGTPRFPQALNSPVPPVWTLGHLLSRPIE
jgi:hypothetical protein